MRNSRLATRILIPAGICAILIIVLVSHTTRRRAEAAQKAKEAAMHSELQVLRDAIRRYEAKHATGPSSLGALVRDGELKALPIDPITRSASTWRPTFEERVRNDDFSGSAPPPSARTLIDVHSGAAGRDRSGRPWSDY